MEIPYWLAFIGSWLGLIWAVYRLFKEAGDTVKEETKTAAALWLLNFGDSKDLPSWPSQFVALFDKIFTKNHWSWKCFRRSAIVSIVILLIGWLLFLTLFPESGKRSFEVMDYMLNEKMYFNFVFGAISFVLLFCIIPDYFSLLETRWILKLASKTRNFFVHVMLIIFDILLSFGILALFAFLAFISLQVVFLKTSSVENVSYILLFTIDRTIFYFFDTTIFFMPSSYPSFIRSSDLGTLDSSLVLVVTTFFTSIWLYLYIVSGLILKLISISNTGFKFLQNNLDIEEKPFRSMGFIVMILISIGYMIGGLFYGLR